MAVLTGSVIAAPPAEAKSALDWFYSTKSYPYPGYSGGTSPAGYDRGWCVDYGIWAWEHWTGTRFTGVKVANFKKTALNRGFKVGTKPKKGALAVQLTVKGRAKVHMAYVKAYTPGAKSFTVREVRWKKVGPSDRSVNVRDIGKMHGTFQFFIYRK